MTEVKGLILDLEVTGEVTWQGETALVALNIPGVEPTEVRWHGIISHSEDSLEKMLVKNHEQQTLLEYLEESKVTHRVEEDVYPGKLTMRMNFDLKDPNAEKDAKRWKTTRYHHLHAHGKGQRFYAEIWIFHRWDRENSTTTVSQATGAKTVQNICLLCPATLEEVFFKWPGEHIVSLSAGENVFLWRRTGEHMYSTSQEEYDRLKEEITGGLVEPAAAR